MSRLVLLAFGFANLAMLGWLAAAAAPLVIHLWSRNRYRESPWAAMQFLLAAIHKNARRLRIQQWLLLALRTLIIAIVVLSVAEPYGRRMFAGSGSAPTHRILVIDGSFSMNYGPPGASSFARAKTAAIARVRNSRAVDSFTVILMAEPAKSLFGQQQIADRQAIVSQIESLAPSQSGADLAGVLTLIEESIHQIESNKSATRAIEVAIFTDLQRVTWGFNKERGNGSSPQTSRFAELAKRAAIELVDCGNPESQNLAVTNVTTTDPYVTASRETTLDVTLHQFGNMPRTNVNVELIVDDRPVNAQRIDVAAGADAAVTFKHRFTTSGQHTIEVRAEGDELKADNTRWLVVPVQDEVRVLCIAGHQGAARYVADALNPDPTGNSPLRPVIISDGDLAETELAGFDCIFACNVAQFTGGEAQRLAKYVSGGGGLVIFLGDRVDPKSYVPLAAGKNPLMPATIGPITPETRFGIDPLGYRHPIVAPFRGRERAGLLTTPISRYFKLTVPPDRREVETAAQLANGDPLIVTAPLGAGRVILVATDGSLSSIDAATGEPWTNWPTWPSFLPVVRELLAYATNGARHQWQQLIGTPLTSDGVIAAAGPAQAPPADAKIKVLRPDGQSVPLSLQPTTTGLEWSYASTDVSGIYSLRGLPSGQSQSFAVNVDTRESDLERIAHDQLPPELRARIERQVAGSTSKSPDSVRAGWSSLLLVAALLLLFVESTLAWQFGRRSV